MESVEQIRKTASDMLIMRDPSGQSERWLWDRACRIVRHIDAICRLAELEAVCESLDREALTAAGYLADAGLPVYAQAKEIGFSYALLELGRPELREFSIRTVLDRLSTAGDGEWVGRVCRIISESDNRSTRLTEAMVLSDARNLEDMGMVGVIQDVRRCLLLGKGTSALLEGWKRKIDYRYWEARFKESFHFEGVRQLAERRFAAAENCMRYLEAEELGRDFQQV